MALDQTWVRETVEKLTREGLVAIPVHRVGPDGVTCSCPEGGRCTKGGKHAIGEGWEKQEGGIGAFEPFLEKNRAVNVGVLPKPSGVVVIDIDPRNGGHETMGRFKEQYGPMPRTKVVTTGSGGWHYYFQAPEGVKLKGHLGGSDSGVDVKYNGFVVAEGSRSHVGVYAELQEAPIAPLPEWVIEEARRPDPVVSPPAAKPAADPTDPDLPRQRRYLESAWHGEAARLQAMRDAAVENYAPDRETGYTGEAWNDGVFHVTCNAIEIGNHPAMMLSAEELLRDVRSLAPRDAGFTDADVDKIIESAKRKVGQGVRDVPEPFVDPFGAPAAAGDGGDGGSAATAPSTPGISGEDHSGQVRMAYRLAAAYAGKLIYVHGVGWHYWTGTHFAEDHGVRAKRAVLDVLGRALRESVSDKELRKDVTKCESASGIAGVMSIAEAMPAFAKEVGDLNQNPWKLNTLSGTLDLLTDTVAPHDPSDLITTVTGTEYDPSARSEVWETFLERVLPDADERAYLQRLVGHTLTGHVTEHVFPVMRGDGRNGKGTFYEAVIKALGGYAIAIDPSMLMATDSDRSQGPEMLRLVGVRLAFASETRDGRSLDEAVMKRLTGGDRLTARNLYKPPVEWEPSHQIVYVTNHLPKVKGDDPAVWARIRVIPFDVQIPKEERDPGLPQKLAEARQAILAWVVQGYREYREMGLREPESVLVATEDYQRNSDDFGRFLEECCLTSMSLSATTRVLYSTYTTWARGGGAESLSEKAFSARLASAGFASKKTKAGKTWVGLAPLAYVDEGVTRLHGAR